MKPVKVNPMVSRMAKVAGIDLGEMVDQLNKSVAVLNATHDMLHSYIDYAYRPGISVSLHREATALNEGVADDRHEAAVNGMCIYLMAQYLLGNVTDMESVNRIKEKYHV